MSHHRSTKMYLRTYLPVKRLTRGFTLVEMLVVVVLIAIIAAIGYPGYTDFVTRSKRQAGRAMVLAVADRQEQFFLDNKRYAADLTELGYAAEAIGVARDGQIIDADDEDADYVVYVGEATDTTYTLNAEPIGVQAERDTGCGLLSLAETGLRTAAGGGENCW